MTPLARGARVKLSWSLLVIVAAAALLFGALDDAGPRTNADRVYDLARTINCPQCQGQSVAESDVAIAREIRADIAARIDAGQPDDEIRQVYIDRYGEWIVLTPSGEGLTSLVWVIPVVAVAAGLVVLGYAVRRWRADAAGLDRATEADRELVERLLAEAPADDD